jgi:AcrR family transcriptional regulator
VDERADPELAPPEGRKGPSPRDRILDASADLFGRYGVQAVGIDGIIGEAEVAKATLYKQFRSKDDLILAWLRGPDARWIDWFTEEVERRTDVPLQRLTVLFDVLEEWFERDDFFGCAYQNTASEVRANDEPIRTEIRSYIQEVKDWLRRLIEAAGLPHADELAERLRLLVAGSIWIAFITGSSNPAASARAAGLTLLEAARTEAGATDATSPGAVGGGARRLG